MSIQENALSLNEVRPPDNGCMANYGGRSCVWAAAYATYLERVFHQSYLLGELDKAAAYRPEKVCKRCPCHSTIEEVETAVKTEAGL